MTIPSLNWSQKVLAVVFLFSDTDSGSESDSGSSAGSKSKSPSPAPSGKEGSQSRYVTFVVPSSTSDYFIG